MATNNMLNLPLSGSTGSGNFVGANTPTLITPVAGVISATSINFGVDALGNYTKRTAWTPTFTCASPGDLALSAQSFIAWYQRVGTVATLFLDYTFTATYTTATGVVTVTGLPLASVSGQGTVATALVFGTNNTFPVGTTYMYTSLGGNSSSFTIFAIGSGVASPVNITTVTSGTSNVIRLVTQYFVA